MGELVVFRPQSRGQQSRLRAADNGESAEIVFFTGVRVGRFEDYVEQPKRRRIAPHRNAPRRAERT
jgi:hypothetical protein